MQFSSLSVSLFTSSYILQYCNIFKDRTADSVYWAIADGRNLYNICVTDHPSDHGIVACIARQRTSRRNTRTQQ
jgi:hypothetical protein